MPITEDRYVETKQSASQVKKYVKRKLGEGELGVDVELDDDQLADSVESSLLWWGGIVGWYRYATISISPNGGYFDVPDDCEEVSEVYFDDDHDGISGPFAWAGVPWNASGYGGYAGYGGYGAYGNGLLGGHSVTVQVQQQRAQSEKVFSTDPHWEFDRDTRKLKVFLRSEFIASSIGREVQIYYQVNRPDITKLHPYEFELVRKYALAEGMETLGNIRQKWIAVPSAQGESSLNGDTLLSNSESLKQTLEEKARAYRRPLDLIKY